MSKEGIKKAKISISIDEKLLNQIDEFCKQNYNAERSAVIENATRKFLDEKKKLQSEKNTRD